ncbi:GTP pyrophosphokinase [Peribacillus frigoritolerans]|uniref:GTP pyrophosphokinase n=1 Tax=Peribacillus frigoritolerans TaxID=450367 RepID=UPI0024C1BA84|nr:hypothetical protein [Peribacillus frigoritolerans]WHX62765.1 hypothetical protein QNH33_04025 [Peribacillus frigoritolerans]
MQEIVRNPILAEYDAKKVLHEEFCSKVAGLLSDIVKQNGIVVNSIDSRVKEESSLAYKVENSEGKYKSLEDITDVSGIRIITYFSDDVDRIAERIQEEFIIDSFNSVDKRTKLDPDRFGYLSLHYVVSLNSQRTILPEYQRFEDLKVEIQIRSILQHAWAEIEHDLGYKNKNAVPKVVRRDFSRLAGILELADEEFIRIRENLDIYNSQIQSEIERTNANVLIDKISLNSLIETRESIINEIDKEISEMASGRLGEVHERQLNVYVERLKYLGFNTLDEVLSSLEKYKNKIVKFAGIWITGERNYFTEGISLFYLAYILLADNEDMEAFKMYLKKFRIGGTTNKDKETLAKDIMSIYINQVK